MPGSTPKLSLEMARRGNIEELLATSDMDTIDTDVLYVSHDERGTSYRLAFTRLPPKGEAREGAPILVVCLSPRAGAYAFHGFEHGGLVHWSYVKEKYPELTYVDAKIVAKLIGQVLGRPYVKDGEGEEEE